MTGREFTYPAQLFRYSDDEIVVSFRDVPRCHTSGEDVNEALFEASDALEEAIAGCINRDDAIPTPSAPQPGEYMVALPADTAAKAALALALGESGMTRAALAERLGVDCAAIRRMLDPREAVPINLINDAMRTLGKEFVLDTRDATSPLSAPSETTLVSARPQGAPLRVS